MLTDKELVDLIWHFKVEDSLSWRFCAGILREQNIKITASELKERFFNYFKKLTGITPYTPCPKCKGTLLPRKSQYGHFIGCSNCPKCRFMATSTNRYKGY